MQGPGVDAPGLWAEGTGLARGGSGPLPHGLAGIASLRQLALAWAWGTAGSTRAARNATPARSFIVQGWATSPDTLTGWPWRRPEGIPGTLTARISASPSPRAMSWTT